MSEWSSYCDWIMKDLKSEKSRDTIMIINIPEPFVLVLRYANTDTDILPRSLNEGEANIRRIEENPQSTSG